MSILNEITKKETWMIFYDYKESSKHIKKSELKALKEFIDNEEYLSVADDILNGPKHFSLPRKSYINKKGTNRKRVVYIYPYAEKTVLQLICYLLGRYDSKFCDNTYAFRMNRSVKDAARDIRKIPGISKKYTVKIDIHDYFNSIPDEILLDKIKDFLCDDPMLRDFLIRLYGRKEVLLNEQIISENHGAMAGTPLSGFMANVYLDDLDKHFMEKGIPYFRYSDDIILFADSSEERNSLLSELLSMIDDAGLTVNKDKYVLTDPGEAWDYLGFSYVDGVYDLSKGTIMKTKQKIRRYAHYLYRKRTMNNLSYEETVARFLKRFNKIFFDESEENEFCWKRWYFTFVTSEKGFHIIDDYMQEYLRYLYSGRHYKGNYRITYEMLKGLGYRNLVNEYYRFKSFPVSVSFQHPVISYDHQMRNI